MTSIEPALLDTLNAGLKAASTPAANENDLGEEDFITLMLAQLSNQDPTKPLNPEDYVTQLSDFTLVEGVHNLQQTLDQVFEAMQSMQAMQATSLIGHHVAVAGDQGYLPEEGTLDGSVQLAEDAKDLTVIISDNNGKEIRRLELGDQSAGEVAFSWDGLDSNGKPMKPGSYEIKAEADIAGQVQDLEVWVQSVVHSVALPHGDEDMALELLGLGEYALSDIRAIY
jgi:flagellar basal-body rod modification protein FlgD